MPEQREGHDPLREARETGVALADQINAELAAARSEATKEALEKGTTTPEIIAASTAVAEARRDTEPVANERSEKEKGRRKACLEAIRAKLTKQETPLNEASIAILEVLMEKTPGTWNEFDGEDIELGKVTLEEGTITIRFECYGSEVGRATLPLRQS